MGKVTHLGWATSSDDIPQPVGIVMGRNLRSNSEDAPKPELPTAAKSEPKKEPQESDR